MNDDIFMKPAEIENQRRLSILFGHNNKDHSIVPKNPEDRLHLKSFQNGFEFQEEDMNTFSDMKGFSFLSAMDSTLDTDSSKDIPTVFDKNGNSMYKQSENYSIQYSNDLLNSSFIANGNKNNKSSSEFSFKHPNTLDTNVLSSGDGLSLTSINNAKNVYDLQTSNSGIYKADFKDASDLSKTQKIGLMKANKKLQPPAMVPRNVKRKISEDKRKFNKKIKVKSLKDVIKRPQIGTGMEFFQKFHLNYSTGQIANNIIQSDEYLMNNHAHFKNNTNVKNFDSLISSLEQDIENYQNVCKKFKDSHYNQS
ncbi:uncharacterized protein HGUI_02899 [Hanseniaspora guilliermondii]|uniref:Uncharacterized protein n=1 Tax=Hanseniaspora guilliermondii TaxID=56406 RepID=A0A1L0B6K1_9ASCO|nr:uncharacterized protein HGUI_02899 [Hanseniaspora guilliermondii]